ncbi:hypothetical protein, partial [Klebsiella sp. Kps]|uniref:hypothetical protein n=1 Tax=Klebsiella sp. Kps TaxID=2758579 RepID=UPI001C98F51C
VMNMLVTVLQAVVLIGYIFSQLQNMNAILIGTVVMIFRYQWDLSEVFYNLSMHYSELVQMNTNILTVQPILDDIKNYAHPIPEKSNTEHWHT